MGNNQSIVVPVPRLEYSRQSSGTSGSSSSASSTEDYENNNNNVHNNTTLFEYADYNYEKTITCSTLLSPRAAVDAFGRRRFGKLMACSPSGIRKLPDNDEEEEAANVGCSYQQYAPSLAGRTNISWPSFQRVPSQSGILSNSATNSASETALMGLTDDASPNISTTIPFTREELEMEFGDDPTPESDLRPESSLGVRRYHVVTTAALPWMTGTAINPLLRAAYLSQRNRLHVVAKTEAETAESTNNETTTVLVAVAAAASSPPPSTVTLVVPWLESAEDRVALYGPSWENKTQEDQELYIRSWLAQSLPLEADESQGGIKIQWYAAKYHARYASIFAMGDICSLFGDDTLDVCFLEEPEHLNVYRAPGKRLWTDIFRHVVGVGHTNYVAYVQKESLVASAFMYGLSAWMVKAYCHKLIKLSPVLQTYAPEKEVVSNIHGIRSEFLNVQPPSQNGGVYFLGKLLWAKGLDFLLQLQLEYYRKTGRCFPMDIVGAGPDEDQIRSTFDKQLPKSSSLSTFSSCRFVGKQDHLEYCQEYKVFVNPSTSEVLCTATAEAVAMGKFVILPHHASNIFFESFPNVLLYRNGRDFRKVLDYALKHVPEPLSPDLKYRLTWEAATERCFAAAAISQRMARYMHRMGQTKSQEDLAKLHNGLNVGLTGHVFRTVLGGGPVIANPK